MRTKTFLKQVIVLMLSVVMCTGVTLPVFAASGGTKNEPVGAAIAAVISMPEGVVTPEAEFGYTFTAQSKDGVYDEDMPYIGDEYVRIDVNDTVVSSNGVSTVTKETGNVLEYLEFPSAGEYEYVVRQISSVWDGATSEMTFSKAVYTLVIYVEKDEDGSIYAESVYAYKVNADDGSAGDGKFDPLPGASTVAFTNGYIEYGDGTLVNAPLSIGQSVTGDYSDDMKYFETRVTLTVPKMVTTNDYIGYVVNEKNENVTSEQNSKILTAGAHGDGIMFVNGEFSTVYLKHGQRLVFPDIYIGCGYKLESFGMPRYLTSLRVDGNAFAEADGVGSNITAGPIITHSGTNTADFLNTRISVVPTGVVINNLPYIMILLLAAGLCFGFIIVKVRKYRR